MNYSNDYKNLGLEIGASKDDIKNTYRILAKQCPPDKSNLNDYQYFINKGFTDPRVLSNYGDI